LCIAALGAAWRGGLGVWRRRHGGRLGLGCIVQEVRGFYVLVALLSFCAGGVLVSFSARRVMMALFFPLHN
jgi:hypothetical protein